jgi:hypothetical protein
MNGLFTICIAVRLFFAYIASIANRKWLSILGYVAILPALGFFYLFVTGVRNKTGAFGEKIWWNHLRPVHGIFYGLFAYFAITGNRNAWMLLLLDALFGLGAFILK